MCGLNNGWFTKWPAVLREFQYLFSMNFHSQVKKGSRYVHNSFDGVDVCAGALSHAFVIQMNSQTIIMMCLLLPIIVSKEPCLDSVIIEFRLHLFGDMLMNAGEVRKG